MCVCVCVSCACCLDALCVYFLDVNADLEHFSEFHFTVIFGDKDRVAPKQMGPALVSHVRRSLGKAWLAEHPSAINVSVESKSLFLFTGVRNNSR